MLASTGNNYRSAQALKPANSTPSVRIEIAQLICLNARVHLSRKQREDACPAANIQYHLPSYQGRILLNGLLIGARAHSVFEHLLMNAWQQVGYRLDAAKPSALVLPALQLYMKLLWTTLLPLQRRERQGKRRRSKYDGFYQSGRSCRNSSQLRFDHPEAATYDSL